MTVNAANYNPGLGTVIMATQYNSLNNDFGNKQQMENYENAVSTDPSRSMIHGIECARKQTPVQPLYIRTGELAATAAQSNDLRFYDLGKMTIATVGQQTNNFVVGELWITYTITFLKPKIIAGRGININGVWDHFQFAGSNGYVNGVNGLLPSHPFGQQTSFVPPKDSSTLGGVVCGGVVPVVSQQNVPWPPSLGGGTHPFPIFGYAGGAVNPEQANSNANAYYFPPGITNGNFLICYNAVYVNAGVGANQSVTSTTGCVAVPLFNFSGGVNTVDQINNDTSATTTTDMSIFTMQVTGPYASFTMVGNPGKTAPLSADLMVIQLAPTAQ